ncbi:4'-phosphopantetheinyl transferase family protein [Seonamhaeicola marinus]|uniref:4'-phosphopantetheinyl transferase superfamily protein n=1 Tax=Seonamhaeicola marinus TaxID=1912246 RepID=A0A5D0HYZ2_9FLAO|nr:4'-phosphopantetheinyl transferase superfamily protein [Seonamhaeicola marinus]TYA74712.1 4'-phosphopantetheinyl transferase superfamily protein [Seonamhaeicola marinus]
MFESLLCEDEKIKANKFKFNKDKYTYIIARGALRLLLGKYLKVTPKSISFYYGAYGKPSVENNDGLMFNVSHSKNLIVIGFTKNNEIGVDVEHIKTDFDVMDIVANYFSKSEIAFINGLSKADQTEIFYRGWTRKEAFIKANAKGLSFPLDAFSISLDSDNSAELYETHYDTNEKNNWRIIPFDTLPEYKGALAVRGEVKRVDYLKFDMQQLGK